jgi:hypothetical protein
MIAAMFATLFVAGLTISSASAAVKWSDISSATHSNAPTVLPTTGGSDVFSRTDWSAVTHGSVAAEARQVGRISQKNFSRSDITSVTHN